jgi:hypothetical protein
MRPGLLTPRDWQAVALYEAGELLGTPEGAAKLAEAKRYGALADELERLRSVVHGLMGEVKQLRDQRQGVTP